MHIGIRLACENCEYAAVHKSQLKQHQKKHLGIQFKCTECEFQNAKLNLDALDLLMDQDYGRDSQHNLAGEGTAIKLCLEMFIY